MIITGVEKDSEIAIFKARLLGSLLFFTQTFFKLQTGREFLVPETFGREPHYITVCRELTAVFNLQRKCVYINIPPGHGKSTLLTYFIAWCFAHYPDCQFIYISYGKDLATKHTSNVKSIMEMCEYQQIFGVSISKDSSAKDNFRTTHGGSVRAFGSDGPITGQDAGLPNLDRFSGCVLMDDMHKPKEVHSDTIRNSVIENYNQTIKPRPRAPNVPVLAIGQRLHESDIFGFWDEGKDGFVWGKVVLPALDDANNILCPTLTPSTMLEREKKFNSYVFWSQYQQKPQPAGGGIFKKDDFYLLDEEPKCLLTFLTVDTAETDKNYNDPTIFSFWGLYKLADSKIELDKYAIHWINCEEIWIEPAFLESTFLDFYRKCLLYSVKPTLIAIEKKSTGVTLASTLARIRGLNVMNVERTKASGNKTARFLEIQPYVAEHLISVPRYGRHTKMCIEHCGKITANDTHAHDDIADTLYDAIKIALIENILTNRVKESPSSGIVEKVIANYKKINQLKERRWQQ